MKYWDFEKKVLLKNTASKFFSESNHTKSSDVIKIFVTSLKKMINYENMYPIEELKDTFICLHMKMD